MEVGKLIECRVNPVSEKQGRETGLTWPTPSWLKRTAILLLVLGIFFRFFNLDHKIYWLDETFTSLRLSGYTQTEFVQQVVTGEPVRAGDLQRYQQLTDRGWSATFKGLAAEEPQLTPLYFTLTRLWAEIFGDSIGAIRSLSAAVSLLAFPALWWLCLELFRSPAVAWLAVGLFAVSPLQVLYAQEARPYSLWAVTILVSSAVLLWAMRVKQPLSWAVYALSVALGLYTHLLFGGVMAAHAIYVLAAITDKPTETRKRQTLLAYGLATGAGSVTLLPWLLLLSRNLAQAKATTASLGTTTSAASLLNQWLVNSSRVFIGWDLGLANLLVAIGLLYGLYFLCTTQPRRVWLLPLALIGVPFLALALPDLLWGGLRSTRIRYLIPCYIALQLALAYLLVSLIAPAMGRRRVWGRAALILIVSVNLIACGVSAQAQVWWNKSLPRSSYYPPVAALINQADRPLVISDCCPIEVLAFSRWLEPDVQLLLLQDPKAVSLPDGFSQLFLLNPTQQLQTILVQRHHVLKRLYKDRNAPKKAAARLWQVER